MRRGLGKLVCRLLRKLIPGLRHLHSVGSADRKSQRNWSNKWCTAMLVLVALALPNLLALDEHHRHFILQGHRKS
jgi:hypothetical protein